MNIYYINNQMEKLHEDASELYEAFFDEQGNIIKNGEFFELGLSINKMKGHLEDIQEDIEDQQKQF